MHVAGKVVPEAVEGESRTAQATTVQLQRPSTQEEENRTVLETSALARSLPNSCRRWRQASQVCAEGWSNGACVSTSGLARL